MNVFMYICTPDKFIWSFSIKTRLESSNGCHRSDLYPQVSNIKYGIEQLVFCFLVTGRQHKALHSHYTRVFLRYDYYYLLLHDAHYSLYYHISLRC